MRIVLPYVLAAVVGIAAYVVDKRPLGPTLWFGIAAYAAGRLAEWISRGMP